MAGEPTRDPANGRFLPGNRFWEARSTAGPKPTFSNPDDLWRACCEYFQWVDENPLWEDKISAYQGIVKHEPVAKMRAMTIAGLCLFLDISVVAWKNWRKERPDLVAVVEKVEAVITSQKFAGAAADLLNANIIARDLGLADKSELTGKDGGAIETRDVTEMSDIERAQRVALMLGKAMSRINKPDVDTVA